MKTIKLRKGEIIVMRSCASDMTSHEGFKWPKKGAVKASDWDPKPECGHGLHGLLWGAGDGSLISFDESSVWLLVAVPSKSIVDLGDKVKFPAGRVVMTGKRQDVAKWLSEFKAGSAVVSGTATAGYRGTATAGYRGTATAGDGGTATAGYRGTATAGDRGTATAGHSGTATAGVDGTATAGHRGTATAGVDGTATAGVSGTATAGDRGIIVLRRWDSAHDWCRLVTLYPGEDGIKPGVAYRLDDDGKPMEVK